ncbi:MAG: flagellar type III secretion system pore protein FliP [Desulfobacterales bacterium]|nr:flagellar type III secretion system pore protein FliP [Desulfobacterales bacterium]MCP4161721.1 flagellar type III secretion system pore protein FliP [Deltaproteobacteria bacterium]
MKYLLKLKNFRTLTYLAVLLSFLISGFLIPDYAEAQQFPIPSIKIGIDKASEPGDVAVALEVIALLTILSLAPAILILMTSFTRILIVFHFLRQALGTQSTPPNQVVVGLTLFITFFIMKPVWTDIYDNALSPYLDEKITYKKAFENAQKPLRKFMLVNTREKDLALFVKSAKIDKPQTQDDVSLLVLIPAFVISELQTAFIIGFVIYVPFLIIDMVVASVLLAMGMMMLPPVMISLPFKLMLFVLVDGWNILIGSMIKSFGV